MVIVECSNCGIAHSSRLQLGGNSESRRERQRLKREILTNQRTFSQILARSLSTDQGGSDTRNLETTRNLQILQQVEIPRVEKGNTNLAGKGSPVYVEITPHEPITIEEGEKKKENKKE